MIRVNIFGNLTRYQLIRPSQHGFVNARSTQTNLLEYMEKLSKLVDEGHSVDVVYCDFSKGFDVVPTSGCWQSAMSWESGARFSGGWRSG